MGFVGGCWVDVDDEWLRASSETQLDCDFEWDPRYVEGRAEATDTAEAKRLGCSGGIVRISGL